MAGEVRLRVTEVKKTDVGRSGARIDVETMQALGVTAGDVIEIKGKRRTAAVVWPAYPEDQGKAIIRMDGLVRRNANVTINEYIVACKAEVQEAQAVILAPIDMKLSVDKDFVNFVKSRLLEVPLVEGDSVSVVILGSAIPFTVTSVRPHGIVKISEATNLQVLEPVEETAKRMKEKEWLRIAWLKDKEKKYASDYTKFRVPELIEDEKEEPVLDEAKKKAKDTSEPVTVYVDFLERRAKIGSLPWALIKPDGTVEYIYE